MMIAIFIYTNYKNQKRSNAKLAELNVQVSDTNTELELNNIALSSTLIHLKETQKQLIETEKQRKMRSSEAGFHKIFMMILVQDLQRFHGWRNC